MAKQNSQTTRPALRAINQGEDLATSIRTHEAEVTSGLNEFHQNLVPPGGEGKPLPDWRFNQINNHEMMLQANGQLLDSDLVFRYARADVKAGVAEAKDQMRVPQRYYSDLVLMVEGTYGNEYLYVVGLDARQARGLLPVREQFRDVHGRMIDPARLALLPAPKPGRPALDFAGIAAGIKAILDGFEEYFEKRKKYTKVLQAASITRNEALKAHRRVYVNIARVQEGWYRLAGLDELADRLRLTLPERRSAEPTEPTDPEPAVIPPVPASPA